MVKKLFLLLAFLFSVQAFATHERAGEITFKHISGNTYEITITTYTRGPSFQADRCSLMVYFGDNDSAKVCRTNFETSPVMDPSQDYWGAKCTSNPDCSTHHMGEWTIGSPPLYTLGIKKNVYVTTHTYQGPGVYIVSLTDPNRNDNIINVSDNTAFSIQDTLMITSVPGMSQHNNSVVLANPPIDKACIGEIFVHNPGAMDPDGDSISYKLGVCFEDVGTPVSGYFIPPGVSVDPITGDFIWNTPQLLPSGYKLCYEYNFAIDIEEWKLNVVNGKRYKVSTVRRDMQITVCDCKNDPPLISNVNDTCIEANTTLTFTATATDVGNNQIQYFDASGAPFATSPPATFVSDAPIQSPSTGVFNWTPTCNEVRLQPYLVTLKATDDGAPDNPPKPLSDYETVFIKVIAPAPTITKATTQCTNAIIDWSAAPCNPVANPLLSYQIFRRIGCDTLKPGYCETGVPASWGYVQVGSVGNGTTTFTDNNAGLGLVHGVQYSYRVIAYYKDGSKSYASDPFCVTLVRDVPVITNVDVRNTHSANGSIGIKWVKPIADSLNYDTLAHPGPYRFELLRIKGQGIPVAPAIVSFSSPFFATLNDTFYVDTLLDTENSDYTYKLDFYDSSNVLCPTQTASSVFLNCNPSDNTVNFTWNEQVPWINTQYDIYKFNKITGVYDSIGTTALQSYTDTGLVNGSLYCYKVKSIGSYPDSTLPAPLINWSQELCCAPVDMTPPCATVLDVDSICESSTNILTWENPNNTCSDDALYYIIYHNDSTNGDFYVVDTINDILTTTYVHDSLFSIAGCYAVTSVDSFGNESQFSNLICVESCPFYQLPNVFTPNGDGVNDFFTPIPPIRYVRDIDIKIFNRWGVEVFRTEDPRIFWDGRNAENGQLCSDGVYYYVCIANLLRLDGIESILLKGNVHLLSTANAPAK